MIQKKLILLVCAAFFAAGCSDDTAVVDSTINDSAILLTDMQLSRYAIDTDTIDVVPGKDKSAADPVNIPFRIFASVANSSKVGSVRYEVRLDGKSAVLQEGTLQPSQSAGTWEADVAFARVRGDVGDYRVDVIAFDENGRSENSAHAKLRVLFGSRPPVVVAVTAPDTVQLQLQTLVLIITAEVTDESGLADIKTVSFNSYLPDGRPSSGNPFSLYDDGQGIHGDATAGDGIYSTKVQMAPNTVKGEYRFEFRALDYSNLYSNVVIHKLIVR